MNDNQSIDQSGDFGDNDDDYTDDQHATSLDYNALTIDDPVDLTVTPPA
ncbi:MAG: hypothetical protein ACRCT2_13885 [Plesiomonas shigelloides]